MGSLFPPAKPEEKQAQSAGQPQSSIFGSGLFQSNLFSQTTLQPGSFGAGLQFTNPFANYSAKGPSKAEGSDGSDGEEGGEEIEKRPLSPETFKMQAEKEGKQVPAMSLAPSPYEKLVAV